MHAAVARAGLAALRQFVAARQSKRSKNAIASVHVQRRALRRWRAGVDMVRARREAGAMAGARLVRLQAAQGLRRWREFTVGGRPRAIGAGRNGGGAVRRKRGARARRRPRAHMLPACAGERAGRSHSGHRTLRLVCTPASLSTPLRAKCDTGLRAWSWMRGESFLSLRGRGGKSCVLPTAARRLRRCTARLTPCAPTRERGRARRSRLGSRSAHACARRWSRGGPGSPSW